MAWWRFSGLFRSFRSVCVQQKARDGIGPFRVAVVARPYTLAHTPRSLLSVLSHFVLLLLALVRLA